MELSEYTSKDMIKKFNATFEYYWHDNEFYLFNKDDENDAEKLKTALRMNKTGKTDDDVQFYFDVIPYSYQQEILDKLQAEREIHDRYKNLIVAATGERVIIVMGAVFIIKSRVSGTLTKNNSCIA